MGSEEMNSNNSNQHCSRCTHSMAGTISIVNKSQLQQWLTASMLCTLLLSTGTLAAPTRRNRAISDVWMDPCNPTALSRTKLTGIELSIERTATKDPSLHDDHIKDMRDGLSYITEMYPSLQAQLADRLPFPDPSTELQGITIEGMKVELLELISSELEWLEITQSMYQMIARAYIHVDQMLQDEQGERNLIDELDELKASLRQKLMCPMFVYARREHNASPIDDVTNQILTNVHQGLSSSVHTRNERNYMVVRDLRKVTDLMHYDLYVS